jgi:hypothetical protein
MNINYDELDEQYDSLPSRTPIRGNTNPQGSLTDNLRMVKVNRDGAIKRLRAIKEAGR